jgi:hypothetical protein
MVRHERAADTEGGELHRHQQTNDLEPLRHLARLSRRSGARDLPEPYNGLVAGLIPASPTIQSQSWQTGRVSGFEETAFRLREMF